MSDASESNLDRVRALVEGRLSGAEAERLQLELLRDPELLRFADAYRDVHALTRAAEAPPPPCTLTRADLERRLGPPRTALPRRVAAAAAVLVALGLALWHGLGSSADEPLVLRAIELAETDSALPGGTGGPGAGGPRVPLATVPAGLTDFRPRRGDAVAWLGELDEAVAYSRASGCPLLVYGAFPGCPMAAQLDAEVFTAEPVLELVDCYVPVRLDLARLPDDEMEELVARGYPFLEVWDDTGASRFALDRTPAAEPLARSLIEGLESLGVEPEPADWEHLRELAGLCAAAERDEAEGRLGAALAGYGDVVRRAGRGALLELGRAGERRLAAEARDRFLAARELAATDVERAGTLLREAAERFAGTPVAEDFAAAARRLAEDGRFPPVAATRAS